METIKIEIENGGQTTISVKGVKGGGCKALTADIESALGAVTSSTPTAEMRQIATAKTKAMQR